MFTKLFKVVAISHLYSSHGNLMHIATINISPRKVRIVFSILLTSRNDAYCAHESEHGAERISEEGKSEASKKDLILNLTSFKIHSLCSQRCIVQKWLIEGGICECNNAQYQCFNESGNMTRSRFRTNQLTRASMVTKVRKKMKAVFGSKVVWNEKTIFDRKILGSLTQISLKHERMVSNLTW